MASKPAKDDENTPKGQDQTEEVKTPTFSSPELDRELDTSVEDQNRDEVKAQIEAKDEEIENPGQLTEDAQGDWQRRIQAGVNPDDIELANPDAVPDENKAEAEDQKAKKSK